MQLKENKKHWEAKKLKDETKVKEKEGVGRGVSLKNDKMNGINILLK